MDKHFYENDIVILPYNSATQSGVIVEAYRHSRTVIAYNVGAISEQIIDHKNGFIVESNNLVEFKQKIVEFFALDKRSRDKYSKYAYELGKKAFTPRLAVTTLNNFLSKEVK
jgi:glycosyltransferase involved in cell wall biosynthesis